jgi:hypothetical protein
MDELSLSIGLVIAPVAFIAGTVRPDLNTVSVSHFTEPVSLVDGTVGKVNSSLGHTVSSAQSHVFCIGIIDSLQSGESRGIMASMISSRDMLGVGIYNKFRLD